ncbi:unnamed protein product [Angiostrongylus costaricensis]|uniref:Uncharacterized protein n=1 Tax=Angiostrongylus costaricensis TaxID=334426 RepID=A0A158PE36_ANGCS|nr:unnamed protein product [Angiostrongylus costaricensis]
MNFLHREGKAALNVHQPKKYLKLSLLDKDSDDVPAELDGARLCTATAALARSSAASQSTATIHAIPGDPATAPTTGIPCKEIKAFEIEFVSFFHRINVIEFKVQMQRFPPQRFAPGPPPAPFHQRPQVQVSNSVPNKSQVPQKFEPRLEIQQRAIDFLNPRNAQIRVPPPPARFIPHLADIYGKPMPDRPYSPSKFAFNSSITSEPLPDVLYEGDEKNVNGIHVSYIEDIGKTSPVKKFGRVLKPQPNVSNKEEQLRVSGRRTTSDDGSFVCCSTVIGHEVS